MRPGTHERNRGRQTLSEQKFSYDPSGKQTPVRANGLGPNGRNGATNQQGEPAKSAASVNLPNGLVNQSLQLANGKSKQPCEVHHSLLAVGPANRKKLEAEAEEEKAKRRNFFWAWIKKFPSKSKRIDVISRIFFPKMFALFNLVYWTTYLFREDDIVQA